MFKLTMKRKTKQFLLLKVALAYKLDSSNGCLSRYIVTEEKPWKTLHNHYNSYCVLKISKL